MSTLHAYFGGGVVGNDGKFVGEAYAFAKNSLKREFEHAYVTLIKLLGKKLRRTGDSEHVIIHADERQRAEPVAELFCGNRVTDYIEALFPLRRVLVLHGVKDC